MFWKQKQKDTPVKVEEGEVVTTIIENPYQADDTGSFFCGYCGWSVMAIWSHTQCEMKQLELEGENTNELS
jgi:hypothetical protein